MIKRILGIFTFTCLTFVTLAQNTTNSPGSMYGLGDVITGETDKYSGMGGVGIALRSGNFLNTNNPAALTALDSSRIVYEVGAMAGVKQYSLSGQSSTSLVGNVTNLGLGARIIPGWYAALGVTPYSSVGYAVTMEQEVEGTNGSTISSLFEGDGGLYRIYLGNALKLGKHFSVGVNLSYVLGNIHHSETQGGAIIDEKSFLRTFYADAGMQYTRKIKPHTNLTFGLIYGYKQELSQSNTINISNTSGSDEMDEKLRSGKKYLPQFFGTGVGLASRRWTVSADYKYLQWSNMESDYSTVRYVDQHRVNVGAELLTGDIWTNPWHWMVGGGVSNSYVVIKNRRTLNYSVSAGIGVPVMQGSVFSAGIRYDWQKVKAGIQQERSLSLYINLSFSEKTWRGKIQ